MATPKTITQLSSRGTVAATDEMEIQVSGETTTKKTLLSALKTFFFGSAVIGGNAAGDIVTTNGTQTQTNKTMTSPRINTPMLNGTTAITVTGDNVNSLASMTSNVKDAIDAVVYDVAFLEGVSSNIQTQLNAKANLASPTFTGSIGSPVVLPTHTNIGDVGFAEIARLNGASENIQAAISAIRADLPTVSSYTKTVSYQATVGSGATTLTLSQAAILGILGLSTGHYVVDHASIVPAIYEINGTYYMEPITKSGGVTASFTVQTINSQVQLDTLTFGGLSEGKVYQISFTCKVIIKATPYL